MAIVTSEKIFVDPNEEIVTVLERSLKSDKEKLIIVVPMNSLLLSSFVSINILFRELAKSKKLAVLVTEDEYGKIIAQKAGFQVTAKVSLITSELWEAALQSKKNLLATLQRRKEMLLENIQESKESAETIIADEELEIDEAEEGISPEGEIPSDIHHEPEAENSSESKPEEELDASLDDDLGLSTNVDEDHQETDVAVQTQEELEAEKLLKKYQKPRREPKIVTIDGLEIYSGGDIAALNASAEYAKIDSQNNEHVMDVPTERKNVRQQDQSRTSNFIGRDFTKPVSKASPLSGIFSLFSLKKHDVNTRSPEDAKRKQKRLMIIGALLILLLFGGGYVLAFQLSSVDIVIDLKKEDISTSATVIVDPLATEADSVSVTIPGIALEAENLNISRSGEANGVAKVGTKAKGLVDITNNTGSSITFKAGTKLTCVETNLEYQLLADLTIDGKTEEGLIIAIKEEDVTIEALDIGEDYNLTGTDSKTKFLIEGYTSSKVPITRYNDFTGGTSKEVTVVSQENIDAVKDAIMPEIKTQGQSKLVTLTPVDYRLVAESVDFVETAATSSPALGEEAKDKTFNLTIEGSMKGIAIRNSDLEEVAKAILTKNKEGDDEAPVEVEGIEDIQIDKAETIDGKLTLTISSKGSIRKTLTVDELKADIAGMSVDEARDYFSILEGIEKYKLTFSPAFIPLGLQRVPSDESRISIKTR